MISRQHRYALTMGEQSEIHVGCPIIGNGLANAGFTVGELVEIADKFKGSAHLCILSDALDEKDRECNEAGLLVIKNGLNLIMQDNDYADRMLVEQNATKYDTQYFDRRRQRALNKRARHNAVFGPEHIDHSEDYKQSTVISYKEVPLLSRYRDTMPQLFGIKAQNLNTEGNFYFENKSGIGFHGDSERKIVICCSLGTPTTLRFCWRAPRSKEKAYKPPFDFHIEHGDIYIMSEKATGFDWRCTSKFRLVHGAGADKYIKV